MMSGGGLFHSGVVLGKEKGRETRCTIVLTCQKEEKLEDKKLSGKLSKWRRTPTNQREEGLTENTARNCHLMVLECRGKGVALLARSY